VDEEAAEAVVAAAEEEAAVGGGAPFPPVEAGAAGVPEVPEGAGSQAVGLAEISDGTNPLTR
jgi:hypothetical protein